MVNLASPSQAKHHPHSRNQLDQTQGIPGVFDRAIQITPYEHLGLIQPGTAKVASDRRSELIGG